MYIFLSGKILLIKCIKPSIDDDCPIWDPTADISDEESNIKFDEFKTVVNNNKGLT